MSKPRRRAPPDPLLPKPASNCAPTSPIALAAAARNTTGLRGIRVQLDVPQDPAVEGDAFLLRRARSNLLDNAIDFSADGDTVLLSLRSIRARKAPDWA